MAALEPLSTYPSTDGLPELREAIAGWAARRFGAALDPGTQVLPTMGSKEAVFSLAQVLGGGRVAVPAPAYPVYERGAAFAGKEVLELPLRGERGFLPDLDAVDAATWRDVAVLWLNYPNNPTAATAPLALYEHAAALAREHGFVVASDEAYSEIYFGEPPVSALQLADLTGVLVLNTLSKRSSMPGYRSGLRRRRPGADRRAQALPAQRRRRAAGVHPARGRGGVGRRGARRGGARRLPRQARRPAAGARGARPAQRRRRRHVLPLARRRARAAEALADELLRAGIVLVPGSYFGPSGDGLPPARARPDARRLRARGRAARPAPALAVQERAAARREAVADLQALGQAERLELAHVGLERLQLGPAEPLGEVGRARGRARRRSPAASPPSRGRGGSRRRSARAAPRSRRGRRRPAPRRRAGRCADRDRRGGTRCGSVSPVAAQRRAHGRGVGVPGAPGVLVGRSRRDRRGRRRRSRAAPSGCAACRRRAPSAAASAGRPP